MSLSSCWPNFPRALSKLLIPIIAAVLYCAPGSLLAQVSGLPVEHVIEVSLAPASGEIQIIDQVRVTGRNNYFFRLAPWLDIESVSLDDHQLTVARLGEDEYVVALPDSKPHVIGFILRGMVPVRGTQATTTLSSSSGSDGVYLPGYDAWIPQDETGLMRYRMLVKVAPGERAVATGKLISEQKIGRASCRERV